MQLPSPDKNKKNKLNKKLIKKNVPQFEHSSRPQTSWYRPGAAGQTQCHSDRGSGNLGTKINTQISNILT